ncbi:Uncharacterised protein [Citrobacter koseri]|uniref:Uncharacterized protein n=1 Tax=Citrobacter koseri TaxID=545 RepID=A0A3S4J0V8_CITKO|nr:Uncharacterised protein [Citrobacter koseri]
MVSVSADINPFVLTRCAKRDPQVTELTGFLAHKRYSTTEFWSNVKQICCQIDESVTLYLIKIRYATLLACKNKSRQ